MEFKESVEEMFKAYNPKTNSFLTILDEEDEKVLNYVTIQNFKQPKTQQNKTISLDKEE